MLLAWGGSLTERLAVLGVYVCRLCDRSGWDRLVGLHQCDDNIQYVRSSSHTCEHLNASLSRAVHGRVVVTSSILLKVYIYIYLSSFCVARNAQLRLTAHWHPSVLRYATHYVVVSGQVNITTSTRAY